MRHTFERYAAGYVETWAKLRIRAEYGPAVDKTVSDILAQRARYEAVQAETGVPWWWIAITHKMESGMSFRAHLHNGDSLAARTRQVPAGRPRTGNPPFTWEESARDALMLKGLHNIPAGAWTLARAAYEFERFNGFGYRVRNVPSPYLWSFTTAYSRGKFVRDGVYSNTAVSQQSGAMALLYVLNKRCGLNLNADVAPVDPPDVDEREVLPRATGTLKAVAAMRTIWGAVCAAVGYVVTKFHDLFGGTDIVQIASDAANEAGAFAAPLTTLAGFIGANVAWIGGAAVAYGLAVVVWARMSDWYSGSR